MIFTALDVYKRQGDIMLKLNYMSTLFVGIDVSSKTNACLLYTSPCPSLPEYLS